MSAIDQKVLQDIQTMLAAHDRSSAVPEGNRFWIGLGEKHSAIIRKYGFEKFKRTVNFEYSQWGVTTLSEPKVLRLISLLLQKKNLPVESLAWVFSYTDENVKGIENVINDIVWSDEIDSITGKPFNTSPIGGGARFRAYAIYCTLLWQYAQTEDNLGCLEKVPEPAFGSPLPVPFEGRIISQDLALSSMELNRMASRIPMGKIRRVLEIGAGYGRLGYLFRQMFPDIEYTIIDIPPALAVSQNYLETVFGPEAVAPYSENPPFHDSRMKFLLPGQMNKIPEGYFDLILNVSSLDEMSPDQVKEYFNLIERVGPAWLYLKGYGVSQKPGFRLGVNEFPYRPAWQEIYKGQDDLVGAFVEKIFRLGRP
ncbi:MAG: hypothetical protein JWO30_4201 [Fibrobacteres bacterium]|nr:hypothetical protein [Fibrobacterota bacterium]